MNVNLSLSEHLVLSNYGTIRKAIYNLAQLPQKYDYYDIEIKLLSETPQANRYQYEIQNKKGEIKQDGVFLMPKLVTVAKTQTLEDIKKCTTFLLRANSYKLKNENMSILWTLTIDKDGIDNEGLVLAYHVSERVDGIENDVLYGEIHLDNNDEYSLRKIGLLESTIDTFSKQYISMRGIYEQN